MDRHGVERAVVIAASLGGNEGNADHAFAEAEASGGRLEVFPDLECHWSPEFRTAGAAGRLAAALERWPMRGFTMYPTHEEGGDWLVSDEGEAFFALAERHGLVASLSLMPRQFAACHELARRHPGLPVLLHHFGFLGPRSGTTPADRGLVEPLAELANVHVKLSGLGKTAGPRDEYPWPKLQWSGELLYELFGAERLIWGSDFPVSSKHMTYTQALDAFRRHGPGTEADKAAILGGNMARLLA
jgi:predicted TIM-barrel fold metal-dependent hydrolase